MRHLFFILLLVGIASAPTTAGEVIPPAPARYCNDYAGVMPAQAVEQLDQRLEAFARETSTQVVVAVFPKMQSDSDVVDYTVRVAQAWGVGQKKFNNGVVLFVFIQNRELRIEVGYGLEGALPDALCKRIIEDEIVPAFKNKDYAGGISAGVEAILKATKGEYQVRTGGGPPPSAETVAYIIFGIVIFIFILVSVLRKLLGLEPGTIFGGGGSWGGGSWGGGSGGGGFSGGGGSFGGGGAGGRW